MRRLSVLLLLCLALLLGGCWSRVEVNDLAIVVAMALDKGDENPVRVTLYIARAGNGGGGEGGQGRPGVKATPVWVVSRESENLSDAMREISQASPRRITLHHLRVALIDEELAREGIDDVLDFLVRNPEARLTTRIMTVKGARAAEVLQTDPLLEGLMSEQLAEILPAKGGPLQRVKEVVVAHISKTHSPWMEEIRLVTREVMREGTPAREVVYAGAALFRRGKLVAQLDQKEARALNWLLGHPMHAVISAPCPEEPEQTFSVEVVQSATKIKPTLRGNRVAFRIEVEGQTDMTRKPCKARIIDSEVTAAYEQALNRDLAERITGVIAKFQAADVDPAGFGKRVEVGLPGFWQTVHDRWPQVWQESEVSVHVDLKISFAGVLIQPPLYLPGKPD